MEQTVLPEHLLNKQTYSDTNSGQGAFAMLLARRPCGFNETVAATCIARLADIFLINYAIIAVQLTANYVFVDRKRFR
jgi:hypothetical protein